LVEPDFSAIGWDFLSNVVTKFESVSVSGLFF